MNDPGTYQIPSEFLRRESEPTESIDSLQAEQYVQAAEVAPAPEITVSEMISEIGYIGDWVVQERNERLEDSELAIGLGGLWRKLGGERESEKSLMSKEAHLSRELFADKQSTIFFFDKVGEGHGEWAINRYNPETDSFTTIYYEVESAGHGGKGSVLVKWPGFQYRYGSVDEVQKLHKITSKYYELIKAQLYQ